MKPPTLIAWLLVAACVAIDLAMIGELQVRRNEWPEAGGVVGLGLVFSQIALLALWVVCGNLTLVTRVVSALLGVWGVSWLASYSATGSPSEVGKWFGLLILCSLASFAPFIIARINRYVLSNATTETAGLPVGRLSSRQFTIWGLLCLMTGVAITLVLLRFAEFPVSELLEGATFFAVFALTGCLILLLSLSVKKLCWAILATIVICPIAGFLLSVHDFVTGETLELFLATATEGLAAFSAALVIRSGGLRFARSPICYQPTASESSDVSASARSDQRDEP